MTNKQQWEGTYLRWARALRYADQCCFPIPAGRYEHSLTIDDHDDHDYGGGGGDDDGDDDDGQ